MGLVTIGLDKVEVAPLAGDGGPGTVFETIGFTSKGTFSFQEDDATVKNVEVEEVSTPLKAFKTAGARRLLFSLADPDSNALALTRGGTVDTAGGGKVYTEDDAKEYECTIRVTPKEGFETIQYNKVSLLGKLNGGLGADQELLLEIAVDILKPTKEGIKIMEIVEIAPTP
ncbi:hypothetical protein [Parapedobacter indicus]|uniref:Uncharacterized protein n=1 Tax=Parapedobacter indicus TaxID=1477437 RepID=A0A1I3E5K4_9SPHI|nr:hypothetical protein [Parapedobacter indicus]PPL04977.1 hypothetical protein CLV26_101788 [Parapedobacter indicus]SFH94254.1 hypothetical protein SAMN05444682_101774 [Parapedobacter indicus]